MEMFKNVLIRMTKKLYLVEILFFYWFHDVHSPDFLMSQLRLSPTTETL
uniref:Uncharacterized protein n=1 Tax=Parascaris univalens TaxID=6257 RepID=A0A915CK58_PARUN